MMTSQYRIYFTDLTVPNILNIYTFRTVLLTLGQKIKIDQEKSTVIHVDRRPLVCGSFPLVTQC